MSRPGDRQRRGQTHLRPRSTLDAIRANFRSVLSHVGGPSGGVEVIAVVKANGYGHGAVPGGPSAGSGGGATMLACADIEEGVELRQGGVHIPILVFGALSVSDLDGVFSHELTPHDFVSVRGTGVTR